MAADVINLAAERQRRQDHIVRGIAAGGMIRAIAITAKGVVQQAHERHGTSPLVSAALGRLLMGGLMMGAMSKNDDELITLVVHGDGPIGGLTVTANNRGQVKGFANHPNVWLPNREDGHLAVGDGIGAGELRVVFDQPGIVPYSSQVSLVSGEIGEDLAQYFALSDQVPTSVGVGVLVNADTSIRQAGGFIIQLMPDCIDEVVDELERNLADVRSVTDLLEAGMSPSDMLGHLLRGLDYEELESSGVEFYCGCNQARAARAVAALGEHEINDMIQKGEKAEVYCHFCGRRHYLSPAELRDLLEDPASTEPFVIRRTRPEDLDEVMHIYAHAREYMAEQGNPEQWGPTNWPPRTLIEQDIAVGKSRVAVARDGRIAAVFYYDYGPDVDPCYARIFEGAWADTSAYGVVHRIASAHVAKGAGAECLRWALARSPHLRIDTHGANVPMQRLLKKLGFERRGIIYVREDDQPRLAFEHV